MFRYDDSGQSNIDFLFGLGILMIAFMYSVTFVPGLFVPYQAGSIDLSSVAYRTSAILLEDPGWYIYPLPNGTLVGYPEWESNVGHLARIGLAIDKTTPSVLSYDKVKAFNGITDPGFARDRIGLNGSILYDYNITIDMEDGLQKKTVNVLTSGNNTMTNNVEFMERPVMIDTGKQLFINCSSLSSPSIVMTLYIGDKPQPYNKNLTARVYNVSSKFNVTEVRGYWSPTPDKIYSKQLIWKSEYTIKKNGEYAKSLPVNYTPGDTIEIIVYNSTHNNYPFITYLHVYSDSTVLPGTIIDYFNDPDYRLKSVCYPGIFRLKVWSYAII